MIIIMVIIITTITIITIYNYIFILYDIMVKWHYTGA